MSDFVHGIKKDFDPCRLELSSLQDQKVESKKRSFWDQVFWVTCSCRESPDHIFLFFPHPESPRISTTALLPRNEAWHWPTSAFVNLDAHTGASNRLGLVRKSSHRP